MRTINVCTTTKFYTMCFSWISTDTSLELKTESNEFPGFIIVRLSTDDHISTVGVDPQNIDCDLQLSRAHQSYKLDTNQLLRPPTLESGPSVSVSARVHHSRPSNIALDASKPTQDTTPMDRDPQFPPHPGICAGDDAVSDIAGNQKSICLDR